MAKNSMEQELKDNEITEKENDEKIKEIREDDSFVGDDNEDLY